MKHQSTPCFSATGTCITDHYNMFTSFIVDAKTFLKASWIKQTQLQQGPKHHLPILMLIFYSVLNSELWADAEYRRQIRCVVCEAERGGLPHRPSRDERETCRHQLQVISSELTSNRLRCGEVFTKLHQRSNPNCSLYKCRCLKTIQIELDLTINVHEHINMH